MAIAVVDPELDIVTAPFGRTGASVEKRRDGIKSAGGEEERIHAPSVLICNSRISFEWPRNPTEGQFTSQSCLPGRCDRLSRCATPALRVRLAVCLQRT